MHGHENRRKFLERRKPVENGFRALGSAGNHPSEFWERRGDFRELLLARFRTDEHARPDLLAGFEGRKRPGQKRPAAEKSGNFVEPHPAACPGRNDQSRSVFHADLLRRPNPDEQSESLPHDRAHAPKLQVCKSENEILGAFFQAAHEHRRAFAPLPVPQGLGRGADRGSPHNPRRPRPQKFPQQFRWRRPLLQRPPRHCGIGTHRPVRPQLGPASGRHRREVADFARATAGPCHLLREGARPISCWGSWRG